MNILLLHNENLIKRRKVCMNVGNKEVTLRQ